MVIITIRIIQITNLKYKLIMNNETRKLMQSEQEQLHKLRQIVKQAIAEEKLIVENLLHQPKEILSRGQSISDLLAIPAP